MRLKPVLSFFLSLQPNSSFLSLEWYIKSQKRGEGGGGTSAWYASWEFKHLTCLGYNSHKDFSFSLGVLNLNWLI